MGSSYEMKINDIESKLSEVKRYDTRLLSMTYSSRKEKMVDIKSEINDSNRQRFLQYTLADAKFEDEFLTFTCNKSALSAAERKELFNFLTKYIGTENITSDILSQIPNTERFLMGQMPCRYAGLIGAAGTGKTTASANVIFKDTSITECAATNSAHGAFATKLEENIKPGSYKEISKDTIYKLLNINCEEGFTKELISKVNHNLELRDSYTNLLRNTSLFEDKVKTSSAIYQHTQTALKILHPLVCYTIGKLQYIFHKYLSKYRLNILDSNHPYYQPTCETFEFISHYNNDKQEKERHEYVKSLEGYKCFIMSVYDRKTRHSNYNHCLPHILTITKTVLIEEAGRLPAYFNIFLTIIWWFIQFLFNTPLLYEALPIIVPSGSDTQSSVIDFPYSMLDEVVSPALIWNREAVLVCKSEHNRRKINEFSDLKTSMHNAVCLSLENFMIDDYIFNSFKFSETFSHLVNDPRIKPNAVRMYGSHEAVKRFTEKIQTNGLANIETWDCVFFSSDITSINPGDFDGIYDERGLSILSEEQARCNRLRMWKSKKKVYKLGFTLDNEFYKAKYTCRKNLSNDTGFNEEIEEIMVQMCEEIKNVRGSMTHEYRRKRRCDQYMTDRELDDIEFRDQMRGELSGHQSFLSDKHDIHYICGFAKDMLSREEHKLKRMHGSGIAHELGHGLHLTKKYYSFAGAQGQTTKMEYDPNYDLCIEIADPHYTDEDVDDQILQESIAKTVNARPVYMCVKRKRYFTQNTFATSGMGKTYFKFCGVCGLINEILVSDIFTSSTLDFQVLVFSGVLNEYKRWVYNNACNDINIDILSMNDQSLKNVEFDLDIPLLEKEILIDYEDIVTKCCDKSDSDFKYISHIEESKVNYSLDVCKLHNSLKRLTLRALNISKDFGKKEIEYKISNCVLLNSWQFLLYRATKPVCLTTGDINNEGDLIVLGPGQNYSALNINYKKSSQQKCLDWEKRMIGKKNIHFILDNAVHTLCPELTAKTSLKVLVKKFVIADVYTSLAHKHISSFEVLVPDRKLKYNASKYGQMMRSTAANFSTNKKTLIHKMFTTNGGECMNFPRPFMVGGTDTKSNIIIKCHKNETHSYSTSFKADESDVSKRKVVESISALALMFPLFIGGASTVDSMQGKTISNQSMVNLSKMSVEKYLVALSRNDSSHDITVASVTEAMNDFSSKKLNKEKMDIKKLTAKYICYR